MEDLKIFENAEFGKVRVQVVNDEPMFCLSDVCNILELRQGDVRQRLEDDVVSIQPIVDSLGRTQKANFVNEDGLYDVILDSRKKEAKKFRKWVTSEVLPSIRKTGVYDSRVPTTFAEALRLATEQQEKIEEQQKLLDVQQPKADFYDDVVESKDALPMDRVAKTLNMGIGRNKLFEVLRGEKILMGNNTPYQKFVDLGWFRCVESKFVKPNGDVCVNIKTVVLQKGVDGIRKLLKSKKGIASLK